MEGISALAICGLIIGAIWVAFIKFYRYSKNLNLSKGPRFARLYRTSIIGISIIFVIGIIALAFHSDYIEISNEFATAIEIILYGMLWTMALVTFLIGFHNVRSRLIIPGLLSGVIILGSIAYAILSRNETGTENSFHLIYVSLILGGILLAKGFFGPLAVASSLSLAAYGLIHESSHSIPLINSLVIFVIGKTSLTLEYLTSIVIVLGALANLIKVDFHELEFTDIDV
jgi:hypothetical protein